MRMLRMMTMEHARLEACLHLRLEDTHFIFIVRHPFRHKLNFDKRNIYLKNLVKTIKLLKNFVTMDIIIKEIMVELVSVF